MSRIKSDKLYCFSEENLKYITGLIRERVGSNYIFRFELRGDDLGVIVWYEVDASIFNTLLEELKSKYGNVELFQTCNKKALRFWFKFNDDFLPKVNTASDLTEYFMVLMELYGIEDTKPLRPFNGDFIDIEINTNQNISKSFYDTMDLIPWILSRFDNGPDEDCPRHLSLEFDHDNF